MEEYKLKQGEVFKNWNEICNAFGWENARGNYKKARLKELESLCLYHKEGNKIIIDEVYDNPKPIEDKRRTKAEYIDQVEKLLIKMLIEEDDLYHGFNIKTKYYLFRSLGMVNNCYKYGEQRMDKSATMLNLPIELIKELFDSTSSGNERILESALNKLTTRKLVKWEKIHLITVQEEVKLDDIDISYGVREEINKNGDITFVPYRNIVFNNEVNTNPISRQATDEELKTIQECERAVLDKHGLDNIGQIFKNNLTFKTYYSEVNEKIREKIPTFINYYRGYKMIYTKQDLLNYVERNKIKFPKKLFHEVNDGTQKNIIEKAKTRAEKSKDRIDGKYDYRNEDDYIDHVQEYNETYISVDGKSRLTELMNTIPNPKKHKNKVKEMLDQADDLFGA